MPENKNTIRLVIDNEKKQRAWPLRILPWLAYLGVTGATFGGYVALGTYVYFSQGIPVLPPLKDYQPAVATHVYSQDGELLGEFMHYNRLMVPLERIPKHMVQAFIASEDAGFFRHGGVDFLSIVRAMLKNIKAGQVVQGGSTITQQVAKSLFLSPEKKISRKVRELILARRIETRFTKEEILFLYLNQIFLGHGAYGVQAAAHNYFHKDVWDLDLAEASLIAGLPQAPSRYSPYAHEDRARQRQVYVLGRMREEGGISAAQERQAVEEKLKIFPLQNLYRSKAPYFTEQVRREALKTYPPDAFYEQGLRVYSTASVESQLAAEETMQEGVRRVDRRQGYRGPLGHLSPEHIGPFLKQYDEKKLEPGELLLGVVTGFDAATRNILVNVGTRIGGIEPGSYAWARTPNPSLHFDAAPLKKPESVFAVGDVVYVRLLEKSAEARGRTLPLYALEQDPKVQGALLSLDPNLGYIRALIGGYRFGDSEFNRAIQSCRQPGSAFKPLVYGAAVDLKGLTPATLIVDSPVTYDDPENELRWKPANYENDFKGDVTARKAFMFSMNIPAIKVLQMVGVTGAVQYARKLGISTPLNADLSLALGGSCVTLWDLTHVYATFNQHGRRPKTTFLKRVEDRFGRVLEDHSALRDPWNTLEEKLNAGIVQIALKPQQVIDPRPAYVITRLMEDVASGGTAAEAARLGVPVAGKTGTTNDSFDTWFMGFTHDVVTGVWIGYDTYEMPLGVYEAGGRTALPIWLNYMERILKGRPQAPFEPPPGIVMSRFDQDTGQVAGPRTRRAAVGAFIKGTEPKASLRRDAPGSERNLFQSDIGL